MCGIFGIISRTKVGLSSADSDVLKQMMLDTAQRGDDSTGLFITDYQDPKAAPTGVKVVGGPHNIIYNESLWDEVEKYMQRHGGAVIGHGRAATRGSVNAKNAHPFQHEHITLVHNGTLQSGVKYDHTNGIEVDSHGLAVAIAEKGIEEALLGIRGAYAIVVHDQKEGCLYIARNSERPLHIYSSDTRHYIMSEGPFLDVIMARYNKKVKDSSVMYFRPEQLIKFDLSDPHTYTNEVDLGAIRLERENAERAAREKEAEENRKKYASHARPVNLHVVNGRKKRDSEKEKAELERELKQTTFCVLSVIPYGVNYKYLCRNTLNQTVCFISDQCKQEYINQIGSARIHSYVKKNGDELIFVRHREIKWIPFTEDELTPIVPPTVGEEPANAGYFLTYNNKRIPKADWNNRIMHEGCNTCAATFDYNRSRDVVLTEDDLLLCVSCAQEFSVVPPDTKVH